MDCVMCHYLFHTCLIPSLRWFSFSTWG